MRPHGEQDPQLVFLEELVEEHATIAGDVIEIDAHTWAIHGSIAMDGEVIMAEYDTEEHARIVLDELAADEERPDPADDRVDEFVARAGTTGRIHLTVPGVHEAGAGARHRGDHRGRPRRPADAAADPVHRAGSRQLLRAGGRARLRPRRPGPARAGGVGRTARPARPGGHPAAAVHTVVVTHSHPDHFGGAARLRGRDRRRHPHPRSFKLWWERGDGLDDRPSDALDKPEDWSRPTPWGASSGRRATRR